MASNFRVRRMDIVMRRSLVRRVQDGQDVIAIFMTMLDASNKEILVIARAG
jgi:hypothetical protein